MPGYPILDRDKQNLEDKFICEYCQSVLRDATRASCGHFFCSSCVKHIFLKNSQGVCSRTGISLFHYEFSPDVSVCNEVLNLAVHCLFLDSGCHWNGRLHDFEDHVGNCSFGRCQGKEMGQDQGYERCSQLETTFIKSLKSLHQGSLYVLKQCSESKLDNCNKMRGPGNEAAAAAAAATAARIVKWRPVKYIDKFLKDQQASGGEDLRIIPCVYPECDVVVKTTNELMKHLENECLYRLEICELCNERVNLNAMKLHQSEECRASPAKLGKCDKRGIPQVKKEQLNVNELLQRQVPFLLSGSKASKIKNSRENSLQFTGEIALTLKEVASGNSDTRNTSSRNSITDQHEQRLSDLENRVAQHDLLIRENSLLSQNIRHLFDAFHDVSNKVDQVQYTLDCQKRDFDAFQENLNALHNEQINLQDRFNRLLESPVQHGEFARLNRSMEVIQEKIARLERYSRSQGGMLANMASALTALADAVRPVPILGVDIQHV